MTNFDNIPLVLTPFADNDGNKDFSFFESGITRQMTIPEENGGARFTRHQMNGIGYLATLGAFLDRVGYPYGRERLDPTSFGGYPKGAILTTEDDGYVREYVSLVDNNTHPLPKEAEDGTYVGNEYWAPTIPTDSASFYPSFSDAIHFAGPTIGPVASNKTETHEITVGDSGWYCLERTFVTDLYTTQPIASIRLLQLQCSIMVLGEGTTKGQLITLESLNGILGTTASCLIPLSKGNTIRIGISNNFFEDPNFSIYCKVSLTKLNTMELQ